MDYIAFINNSRKEKFCNFWIEYAIQLRASDPFREQTYRVLMTLYEGLGDRAAALRVYHACATTLERELGAPPDPKTEQSSLNPPSEASRATFHK